MSGRGSLRGRRRIDDKTRVEWTPEMVSALIETYLQTKDKTNLKGTRLWMKVSDILVKQGFKVTEHKCDTKWDALMRTYKGIVDRKKQTGTSPQKKWQYFDEMDFHLYKRPEIVPPTTASSLKGYEKKIAYEIKGSKNTIGHVDDQNSQAKRRKSTVQKESPMTLRELNQEANWRSVASLERKDQMLVLMKEFFQAAKKKRKDSEEKD